MFRPLVTFSDILGHTNIVATHHKIPYFILAAIEDARPWPHSFPVPGCGRVVVFLYPKPKAKSDCSLRVAPEV
jgi:hypothetical protein